MKNLPIFGLLFLIGSFFFLKNSLAQLAVAKNGEIVEMVIKKIPTSCIGTRANHFMTLEYNQILYDKKIGPSYCEEHHVGEIIKIKFLENSDIILFPDENPITQVFACIILGLFGLGMIIYGLVAKKR